MVLLLGREEMLDWRHGDGNDGVLSIFYALVTIGSDPMVHRESIHLRSLSCRVHALCDMLPAMNSMNPTAQADDLHPASIPPCV
jgi:hypothetical protein